MLAPLFLLVSLWFLLWFDSTRSPGAVFSFLGCYSHSEEKAPLQFCLQIFPIQPTFQMFESHIATAARQALQNYTAKFSNTTKAAFIESFVCVCVCGLASTYISGIAVNTKENYLF